MHHGTYAVNQTGSTWHTELCSNLYFERTWVCLKYSFEPGSILNVKPVVLFAQKGLVNLTFSNVQPTIENKEYILVTFD